MSITLTPEQRAAVLDHVAQLNDESIAWLAFEKHRSHTRQDRQPTPTAVLEVALRVSEDVVVRSYAHDSDDARSNRAAYSARAAEIRAELERRRAIAEQCVEVLVPCGAI